MADSQRQLPGSSGEQGYFNFDYLLDDRNRRIGVKIDFSSQAKAIETAKKQILKVDMSVVKGATSDERTNRILDYIFDTFVANFEGDSIELLKAIYKKSDQVRLKNEAMQSLTVINPSLGVLLQAIKKTFGDVSSAELLYENFGDLLTEREVAKIRVLSRSISEVNSRRASDESNLEIPLSKQSKAEKDKFFEKYQKEIDDLIGDFMPWRIISLSANYLPQESRDEVPKRMLEYRRTNNRFPNAQEITVIRKDVLLDFKKKQLRMYIENRDLYRLPSKSST